MQLYLKPIIKAKKHLSAKLITGIDCQHIDMANGLTKLSLRHCRFQAWARNGVDRSC